jgi:hypothetical protein
MHLGRAESLERGRAFDLPEPAGHAALGPRALRGRAEHEHGREEVGRERDERLEEERLRAEPRCGGVEQLGSLVLSATSVWSICVRAHKRTDAGRGDARLYRSPIYVVV